MGKKTGSRKKYRPFDEDKDIGGSKTHHKRNEVDTTNGNNIKVDVKKNEVGNNNECNISLIKKKGIKLDANCGTNQEKNIPDSKKKEGKILSIEHREEILNDTTAQNEKVECDESIIINKNDEKSYKISGSNRKKHNKTEYNEYKNNSDSLNKIQSRQHNQNEEERESRGFEKHRNNKKHKKESNHRSSSSSNRKKENIIQQTSNNQNNDHNKISKEQHNKKKCEKQCGESKKEWIDEKNHEERKRSSSSNRTKQNKKDEKQSGGPKKERLKDEECFKNTVEPQKLGRKNKNSFDKKDYNKGNDSNSKHNSSHYLNKNEDKRQPLIKDGECVLKEIDENLFNLPKEFSFAHCVAEDLRMGAGIAIEFKRIYGGVGQLIDQNLKVGDVGIINRKDRYVFYLITKKKSSGKPTMISLEQTLRTLFTKMKEQNLTKLGIPKIGCGLDGLDWSNVKSLINQVFNGSGIHITACLPSNIIEEKRLPSLKVFITPKNLWEIQAQTHIIIFIDLDKVKLNNWSDKTVDKVNDRYPFKDYLLKDIKTKTQNPGEIISYFVNGEIITCAFVIHNSYTSIENVFISIKRLLKGYTYLAIQSGSLDFEDTSERIARTVLILRSIINKNELWLCGNTELEDGLIYDQYCKNKFNLSMNSSMNRSFNYSVNYNSSHQMDYTNSSNSQERNDQNRSFSTLQRNNYEKDVKHPERKKKFDFTKFSHSSNQMDYTNSSNTQERNDQNRSFATLQRNNYEKDVKHPEQKTKFDSTKYSK